LNKFIEADTSILEIKKISKKDRKLKNYIETFCLFKVSFLIRDEEKLSFYSKEIQELDEKLKKDKNILSDLLKVKNFLIKMQEKDLKKLITFLEEN
jgi:hypothetical protein